MAVPFSISALQEDLAAAKAHFDKWAISRLNALEDAKVEHVDLMREADGRVQDLSEQEERLNETAAALQKLLEEQRVSLEHLQLELADIQDEEASLPSQIKELEETVDREKKEIDQEISELEDGAKVTEDKAQALLAGGEMYRKHLGLRFEHTPKDLLRLVFTQIDPRDPKREFSVQLHVTKTYTVLESNPQVPGVQELQTMVNETNDFSLFVRLMRRKFKELVDS